MANPLFQSAWHRNTQRGPHRWRRLQFGVAWFSLFALTAVLLWASTWLSPPRPARLILLGAGYQDNLALPHNVYGWQSLNDLARLTQFNGAFSFWGTNLLSVPEGPQEVWSDTAWDRALNGFTERTVVLFVTMHGAADNHGALLFTADVDGSGNPKHRLRLTEMLDRLARLPSHKQKVLVLDTTQMLADCRLGLLSNGFASTLKQLESRIAAVPNLVVLCASDAGQRSWVCDELRRTIYAHYVMEGLQGGASDLENDGRINAWELHRYVLANVQGWVQANRAAQQTPLLLPSGEEGRQRARRIDLSVVRRHYRPPEPQNVPTFEIPPELEQAWQRHQQLAQQMPPPAAYSPQTWRLYQDTLLRYEQLLQAGDRDWAARLESRLQDLSARIEQSRRLELASLASTFSMPAAAGCFVTLAEDAMQRAAADLWAASASEARQAWLDIQARLAPDATSRTLLRVRLSRWLLERAAEDPDTHLDRAARLLQTIDDTLRPRPVEAHFVIMLQRDLPAQTSSSDFSDLLRTAISVRVLAEEAALGVRDTGNPYSEFIWDRIASQIRQADDSRRTGEDLLLASPEAWPQARGNLESARAGYLGVLDTARQIQTAMQTRDDVLSLLPYYSHCVAQRLSIPGSTIDFRTNPVVDGNSRRDQQHDELARTLVEVWQATHELCEQLEHPLSALPAQAANEEQRRRGLDEQAELVRRSFDTARRRLSQWWQALSSAEVPSLWHEADAALLVPHRDPQLRMKLLINQRRTSRRLFVETANQSWRKAPLGAPRANHDAIAPQAARYQGMLALAVLGRRWFDACKTSECESYDQVGHRLNVFSVEQNWQQSLAQAGLQISLRWRQQPLTIQALLAESRTAPEARSLELVERADHLTRHIDALGAQSLAVDPVAECRRRRMQALLVWQAERTFADHWYAEDSQQVPYYQLLGEAWLNDAQRMNQHAESIGVVRQRYATALPLTLTGTKPLQLTSQCRQELVYQLNGAAQGVAGFPVVWIQPARNLDVQFPQPGQRLVREVGGDRPPCLIPCTLTVPRLAEAEAHPPRTQAVETAALQLQGLFRGQRLAITTPIELHLAAATTTSLFPLPERGNLAVRADAALQEQYGQARGAVTIVLDCSGSMGPPRGQNFGATTKFAEATTALEQVLARLPRGTTVSIWVFGQAAGEQKTVNPPERTIRRVQDPVRWEGNHGGQLAEVMQRIKYPALEPWNESPIVAAMLAAKADLVGVAGFRTLLVLTDGMDNRFEQASTNRAQADIATALRTAFDNTDITVNIVGFKVVAPEAAHAQRQFSVVETLDPPGKFITVEEADSLVAALDAALRPRLQYSVLHYDRTPVAGMPATGLEIGRDGAGELWFPGGLTAGSYRLRVSTSPPALAEVGINRGDLLLLKLAEAGGRFKLSRLDWSRADFPWKPYVETESWRLSLLQNQRTPEGDLRLLVALEKRDSNSESVLQQTRPREAWLEVSPRDGLATQTTTRWHYLAGYPAAVWSVHVPAWPLATDGAAAPPRVQLAFNTDQETPASASLRRHHDFTTLADFTGRTVLVGGDEVRIDQVSVERHVVESRPGFREPQMCLVVRLSHAPQAPVWTRLGGVHSVGQEHRYYSEARQYTGLFWPVTPDQAELDLSSLSLVSISEFQREARRRGCLLELNEVPSPTADDLPPSVPLAQP